MAVVKEKKKKYKNDFGHRFCPACGKKQNGIYVGNDVWVCCCGWSDLVTRS